ncbi:MAG: ABC transporter substrate-binding protein [Limnochordaceae bacterium]|nr:ABC transporter substrate-binding protein [Limnochordaceae bacterium]
MVAALLVMALAAGASAARTRVVFWTSHTAATDRAGIEKIVKAFNESQDQYEAVVQFVPGAETDVARLMTAVAGGTGPDAYLLDRFTVAQRAAAGVLTDLTPFIKEAGWDAEKDYLPFAWAEVLWNGRVWGLPFDTDARALWYRKDHFAQAGLDAEHPPQTIAQLDQAVEKLTQRRGPRIIRLGLLPWAFQGWHYTWGWAFGGEFYDAESRKLTVNDPRIVESFAWQKSYADKYGVQALQSFSSAFGQEAQDPFIAGQLSMAVDGDWRIAVIRTFAPNLSYGIGRIPTKEGVAPVTWAGGWSIVVPKGAKNPKGGFAFARFFTGPEGQRIYTVDTAHMPTHVALQKLPEMLADKDHAFFANLLPTAKSRPPLPVGGLLWDELTAARDYVINGQKLPKQALDDVIKRVQPELDKAFQQAGK